MLSIQQGDMLKISGLPYPMIVVSNDFFNQEGAPLYAMQQKVLCISGSKILLPKATCSVNN